MEEAWGRQEEQHRKMTQEPVEKLIVKLAVPTIISMMVTAVYNLADTYFVSQLGTSASGAVGIVFSVMAVIQAGGFMLGMGAGSNVSRLMGQQEYRRADEIGSTAFFTALVFGAAITGAGLLFLEEFMRLLGATPTILPYARDYARFILLGAPIMCGSFVLNNLLRSQGRATLSMIGLGLGGVLNILLDPIFIFQMELGISGAALATLLSQCVSFGILWICFLLGKSSVKVSVRLISRSVQTYALILKTGLPSFCRQGLASAATVALNVNAAVYGDSAVAAMSIVGRIFMLVLSMVLGFGQGYQPVVGYNFGARRFDRVKRAFWFALIASTLFLAAVGAVGFFLAPQVIALFRADDLEVIAIGSYACRAQCLLLALEPLIVLCNMSFQTTGRAWQAILISSCRQGLCFLPLIFLLPRLMGLRGIQLTQPAADICTFLICIPFAWAFLRDLDRGMLEEPVH